MLWISGQNLSRHAPPWFEHAEANKKSKIWGFLVVASHGKIAVARQADVGTRMQIAAFSKE
jgi:hypothetical protein